MRKRNRRLPARASLRRGPAPREPEREEISRARLRLQEGFLSHVSHELRTPLASIHQFTTLLLDGLAGGLDPEAREYLAIVLKNAEQLKRMIGDLLTLTHCGSGKLTLEPAFLSLGELIEHACRSLQNAAQAGGVSLATEFPANLPLVCMDAARIYEVLANLIDNAIKYTPRGGKVLVKAGVPETRRGFVRVSVCDTGRGIARENAKRVFERFYQVPEDRGASRRGLGLGLYISQELVKAHGGSISLASEPGRGTTVSFTLPIFSLAPLILPLLSPQNLRKGSALLITIKLPLRGLSAGPAHRSTRIASDALKRCIRSGSDLLLPTFEADPARFHVLAFAHPAEAASIIRRIQQDLAKLQAPALLRDAVEAFATTLALPRSRTAVLEVANRLSRRIGRLVDARGVQAPSVSPKKPGSLRHS